MPALGTSEPIAPPWGNQHSAPVQGFVEQIAAGTQTVLAVPQSVDFRGVPIGGKASGISGPVSIIVANMGTATVGLNNIQLTGNDYSIVSGGTTGPGSATLPDCTSGTNLVPATSCVIDVNFSPAQAGRKTGTITVSNTASANAQTIQITGFAISSAVSFDPPSGLTFSNQVVGTLSAPQTISIVNSGSTALTVTNITLNPGSGMFSQTNTCTGVVLAPQGSCTVSVVFAPTKWGPLNDGLTITDTAADSLQTLVFSGTAVSIGLAANGVATQTVQAGRAATYTFTIGGQGIGGSVSLACTGLPQAATCNIPPDIAISPTGASTFQVVVNTSGTSGFIRHSIPFSRWTFAAVLAVGIVTMGRKRGLGMLVLVFVCLASTSCGGGGNGSTTTSQTSSATANIVVAGTYPFVVTAVSGTATQSAPLTLIVE